MEKVAHRFRSFAIEAADGEPDLVHRLDDLVDHFTENQAGEVKHGGRAHAGADVGRAGGQVAQVLVVGEIELRFQRAVDFIDQLEGALELQAGADRLHPQVILFVHHDAQGLATIHDHGAAHAFGGVLAADEMPLDQDLFLQGRKVLQQF